jgi:transposase
MAKFNKDKFDAVIKLISEGSSVRKAVKQVKMSAATFYQWLNEDEECEKRYARATDERGIAIYEETMEIADDTAGDVQRDRLRVDTRKWFLSKLNPKKYSDKLQVDTTEFKEQPLFPDVPEDDSDK